MNSCTHLHYSSPTYHRQLILHPMVTMKHSGLNLAKYVKCVRKSGKVPTLYLKEYAKRIYRLKMCLGLCISNSTPSASRKYKILEIESSC